MSDLSALKKLLNRPGNTVIVKNFRTNDLIKLDQTSYNCHGAIFEDCYFKGLELSGINLNLGIKFLRTRIVDLSMTQCNASGYVMEFNKNDNSCEFDNCDFTNQPSITSCEFERGFQIRNSRILKDINLINNKAFNIEIINSQAHGLYLSINKCTSRIRFSNSEFKDSIRLEDNRCSYFTCVDSKFKSDVWIWAGSTRGITINRANFEDTFKIEAVICIDQISIIDSDFKKDCNIAFEDKHNNKIGKCPKLHVSSTRFLEGLLFDGKITNGQISVENIKIISTSSLSGSIRLKNLSVDNISLSGVNSNCLLAFDSIEAQSINILDYSNYSTTHFLNIKSSSKKNSSVSVLSSSLGKTLFSNFNFKSFEKIIVANSIFTEITAASVIWFEPTQIFSVDSSKKGENGVLRELFRQLKFAMEKQGDYIQALSFKSFEYEAFHKEIKLKSYKDAWQDKFTLFFGSINKHGINWFIPVIVIATLTFVSSSLITLSHFKQLHHDFSFNGIKNLLNILNLNFHHYFFQFVNPAFQLEKIYDCSAYEITVSMNLLSFLHRILLSVLIYQTIIAFRKYSK